MAFKMELCQQGRSTLALSPVLLAPLKFLQRPQSAVKAHAGLSTVFYPHPQSE